MTLARCLAEQRACLEYLKGDGPDKAGARAGLRDWLAEEVEIRLEQKLPTPHYDHAGATVYNSDVLDALQQMEPESFDACLTDPPYGLSFMGH